MSTQPETSSVGDIHAQLEAAFLDEYLRRVGLRRSDLGRLPEPQATALMREASLFASLRLSEVESRSQLVHEIHRR